MHYEASRTREKRREDLGALQTMDLEHKLKWAVAKIRDWNDAWKGKVHVSFSGGKDSTVLLDIVRGIFPEMPAVWIDTGLEYPEIREFVRGFENVRILRPRKSFLQVVQDYGFPLISKRIAQYVHEASFPTERNKAVVRLRTTGIGPDGRFRPMAMIPKKWQKLLKAPFRTSHYCCEWLKKKPAKQAEDEMGSKPMLGMLAADSENRKTNWILHGCNAYYLKRPVSWPLAIWTEQDILEYIRSRDLKIAAPYGKIVGEEGNLRTTDADRTGCLFCGFGIHMERTPNRFQRLKKSHPRLWNYVIEKIGMKVPLEWLGIEYE